MQALDPAFTVFMEAAPDAIVVIDRTGTIRMVNGLAEQVFGHLRDAMVGQTIELLVPERFHPAHERHRDGYFREPRTRRMGEGRVLAGRRADGREFPVEISLSPIVLDGETLVMSIIRDVTPRKQLEAKFQGLLESAPDGIVVVDTSARIVIVNGQAEKMFGYARDELVGQPVEILVPDRFRDRHVGYRDGFIGHPDTRPMGAGRLLSGRKKDGTEFPVEISLSPLETEHGTLVTSIVRDVTERRLAEERIQASLREKEALLKEIHHRVKNNLQITSSLLRLQSDYIQDAHSRELFAESQNRIRSMALVHEKLYRSSDLSRIDFTEYARSLAELLLRSFGFGERVRVEVGGDVVFLPIGSAVPCGLIVNELVSNAVKHAFPGDRAGRVEVHVAHQGGRVALAIADDGVGLPPGFDLDRVETLGLQLVRTLVQQLDGTLAAASDHGARFLITFAEQAGAAS